MCSQNLVQYLDIALKELNAMSVPSYFSPVAKILIQSGYINAKQMHQVFDQFQESGRSIAQGGLSLIEVLESITGQPLPKHLRHHLWRNSSCCSSSFSSSFTEKLIQSGYVTHDQMQQALAEARKSGRPLAAILESITGRQFPPDLLRQSKQQRLFELQVLYGVKALDIEKIDSITFHQTKELIETLISVDICRRYRLLPVRKTNTKPPSVVVAMVDPDNLDAQDDLNRILRSQGITFQRMVITQEDYIQMIVRYLDDRLARQKQLDREKAVDIKQDLEIIENPDILLNTEGEVEELDLNSEITDAPIISLVNRILAKALQEGVSDIHVEPQENDLRIRFRKDGVLRQAFDPIPKKVTSAVAARFKIMAELDIGERRLPQNGKIRRMFQGRTVDFRVNIVPSRYGETVVLPVLDSESRQLDLNKLITDPDTQALVRELARRPFGLIVVTGLTDSGKSTTLYSILAERNNPRVKICTAEDPVEYSLLGITQVQVLREKGRDFASMLQAFLLQDPDVIMIGEIPDKETAKLSLEAALTGHLVLTVLHASDTADAIARLSRMGVELYTIANALIGVISQRLMRRICFNCRIPYHPSHTELARFGWSGEGEVTLYKANTLRSEEIQEAKSTGPLCQRCNGIGYKGRVAAYEVMCISEHLQILINQGASTEQIREAAIKEGMKTLLSYSLDLAREGYTTLAEVERLVFTDSRLEVELKAQRQRLLTPSSSSDAAVTESPTNRLHRLQELEKQLEELTHQFQHLKKELEN